MNSNNDGHIPNQPLAGKDSSLTGELTQLGNQAVKRGLISGHGYHQGKYEISYRGQIFSLSPEEAHAYLLNLVEQH